MQTITYSVKEVPKADIDQVIDLWSLAFNLEDADPRIGTEASRQRILQLIELGMDYVVGAYDGASLAAVAAVIDFPTHVGNRWLTCGGIAGVATHPQHRRQNLVNKLLADCLQQLHKREVAISALWPFDYGFYGQMGWSVTNYRYKIETATKELRRVKGKAKAYEAVPLTEHQSAKERHSRWIQTHNLSMERNNFRWKQFLMPPHSRRRLYLHKDGYMVWNLTDSNNGVLQITEWCYLTDQAFADGLALLSQMDSQYDKVSWISPEVESLYKIVGPSKAHYVTQLPGMMSRVVHLDSFMDQIGNPSSVVLRDPLGISAAQEAKDAAGPGELVQHVTGFWQQPTANLPERLFRSAAQFPAYSAEQY